MSLLNCALGGAVCAVGWRVQCLRMSLPQPDPCLARSGGLEGPGQGEHRQAAPPPTDMYPHLSLVRALGLRVTSACAWLEDCSTFVSA